MVELVFFVVVASVISFIDVRRELILDKIILPAIVILLVLKFGFGTLSLDDLIAVLIVLVVFVIPIAFNMSLGGGDLRFGAFCALFLGLANIGVFIALAGLVQLTLLAVIRKKSFAFAPAMSIAALGAYFWGSL